MSLLSTRFAQSSPGPRTSALLRPLTLIPQFGPSPTVTITTAILVLIRESSISRFFPALGLSTTQHLTNLTSGTARAQRIPYIRYDRHRLPRALERCHFKRDTAGPHLWHYRYNPHRKAPNYPYLRRLARLCDTPSVQVRPIDNMLGYRRRGALPPLAKDPAPALWPTRRGARTAPSGRPLPVFQGLGSSLP
jgi:hypothetical protein